MKILIVGNLFPPVVYGGYEILCAQVVESLRRRGHEVSVLTSAFRAEEAPPDPRVHRVLRLTTDFPRPGEEGRPTDFTLRRMHEVAVHNEARALEVMRATRPDVVFGWCLNRLSLGPLFAASRAGVPVCLTINDEHPRQFRFDRRLASLPRIIAQRVVWPRATYARLPRLPKMTIISQALKRRLLDQGAPVEDAQVILQGIDLARLAFRPTTRTSCLRLMYAGQLSAAKGVHTLIEAVARVSAEVALELDLYGDGVAEYEARLRELVRVLGLEGRVRFRGRLPHHRLCEEYRAHDVLVFPSEWEEPFGLTHLEAMASGCAVVSTTTGGSAELVRDGVNALAWPAGDAAALAACLRRVAGSERLRQHLIAGARAWVETHHDFERYVDRLDGLLVECRSGAGGDARSEVPLHESSRM